MINRRGEISATIRIDGLVKSPGRSLRGARRRGNLLEIPRLMRLPGEFTMTNPPFSDLLRVHQN